MRRQATLGALLLIVLGVALGATVFRSDIAQATGLKQSQSVIVDNTAAEAVPVREQAALQPVQVRGFGTFAKDATFTGDVTLYTVPAGKTLVLDSFSFQTALDPNDHLIDGRLDVELASSTNEFLLNQPAVDEGLTTLGARVFAGAAQLTLYAGPGTDVLASAARGGSDLGGTGVVFSISGHLVNTP